MTITLTINDSEIEAEERSTILEAAQENEIYIPRLCYHPSLGSSHGLKPEEVIYREDGTDVAAGAEGNENDGGNGENGECNRFHNDGSGPEEGFEGCRLCLVEIQGRDGLITSCDTIAEDGIIVNTETDRVKESRRDKLAEILRDHPHACLQCAQQEGCSRTQCSTNVPEDERCCPLLGHCELQKISLYVGIRPDLVKYVPKSLPNHCSEPLFDRDYNLCIGCLRCVRACRDLREIDTIGFIFRDSKVIVGPLHNSMYAESNCRFCGACVEVCPTGAIRDKDLPEGEREEALVPCIAGCPAGIDVPRYIRLIGKGQYNGAAKVIQERIPFPGILGRICFHPCEDVCRRGELNQPMAICALKWFAADNEDQSSMVKVKDSTGRNVAVVGSGPSGLSAAYYLALSGHHVTIFEAEEKIGGMLRYAIPDYRLSSGVLDRELAILESLNIDIRTGVQIGNEITLSDLRRDYDAVFMGTGACLSKRIPVEGSELNGVEWGLDFLKAVKTKNVTAQDLSVYVIGGGNVAMDVARSCIRLGAKKVQLACLESEDEMPAHDWEIEEAREEGVVMHPSWGPKRIIGGDGKVIGIELVKCTSVFDRSGNFAPKFDDNDTMKIETGRVILAIGQTSDLTCLEGVDSDHGTLHVDGGMQSNISGVFAGGEVARGPSSVVEAIADGARAASVIDVSLGGDGNIYPAIMESDHPDPCLGTIEGFAGLERMHTPKNDAEARKSNFQMVEGCYPEDSAKGEAIRCLQCDLRLRIQPVTLPPDQWFELNTENVDLVPASEGVFQLLDEDKMVIVIKGTQNLQADLREKLDSETNARYFSFEPDPMYTKRESEMIQQFLQQYGKMPEGDGGEDDLDDLF